LILICIDRAGQATAKEPEQQAIEARLASELAGLF